MRARLSLLLAVLLAFALLLPAQAFADPPIEKVKEVEHEPPPTWASFDFLGGNWMSEWGEVTLEVSGMHCKGRWKHGTFEGDFDQYGVLNYTWSDAQGNVGLGVFNLQPDGDRLVGRFGYDKSNNNGGDWSVYRPKEGSKKATEAPPKIGTVE